MSALFKEAAYFFLDSIDSTNSFAWQKMGQDAHVPIIVTAKEQVKGKGLGQNSWHSAYGKNLLLSLGFKPYFYNIDNPFLLNKITALTVKEVVESYVENKKVSIKWPNDIYIGSKKVAGILIENSFTTGIYQLVVAGIGLNVNQTEFPSDIPFPTSLKLERSIDFGLDEVLKLLISKFEYWFALLKNGQILQIDEAYRQNLYRYQTSAFYIVGGEKIKAVITGVDDYGKLCLKKDDNSEIVCEIKQVVFVP